MSTDSYRLILDIASEGFWDWDLKTDRAYLSPRYCDMVGYAPGETIFDSAFLKTIIHPDDHRHVFQVIQEHLQGKRDLSLIEYRMIAKNGQVRWIEGRGKIVEYDAEGNPSRMVGTVVDISNRKKTEEALRKSHDLLSNLSEQVPGVLFHAHISPDGHASIPYSSEKIEEIYEVSPEQVKTDNNPIVERFHPDDSERINDSIHEATGKLAKWECEYRVILPRQGLKWLYGVALPQKREDGSVDFYGIIMDISERKRIEENLLHSQQLLTSVVDNAPYAFFIKDVSNEFRVILWNKAAEQIFGIPAATILGKNAHDLWPREQADAYLAIDRSVVNSRTTVDAPEEVSSHPEKGKIWLHTRKIPLINSNGEVSHIVVISNDITERRLMQLEQVRNQKLESLGLLAGGIAHDFNNILTGITGYISFARTLFDESLKVSKILREAENASHRATDLARQLLTFAKGGQPIKKALSVKQVVDSSASLALRGTRVTSITIIPDDLPAIEVDEGQINQVFNNIIINALQAMPGGGTVTIRAETVAIKPLNIMSLPPGMYVRLTFADTGCGISEKDQKVIFDPYFTTKSGGSGLGLATAHSIIAKHGGYIGVSSTLGGGTTFEILLPASDVIVSASESDEVSVELGRRNNLSVLVMDDEEIIRNLTTMMLDELGYHTLACANGNEAIALYRTSKEAGNPFSAVIMDLTIPGGMGGKEAASQILSIDPHARLVVSSGYSNDPIMAEYSDYGFSATLPKPYTIKGIKEALEQVLPIQRPGIAQASDRL